MKILVCGGRDYADRDHVFHILDRVHTERGITQLIHGGAAGADSLADSWARIWNVPVREFPADWKLHGKAAGPLRNEQMLKEGQPDGVIAFPGGRGTDNMVSQARAAGVRVWKPRN